jgi:hypothetical protein
MVSHVTHTGNKKFTRNLMYKLERNKIHGRPTHGRENNSEMDVKEMLMSIRTVLVNSCQLRIDFAVSIKANK